MAAHGHGAAAGCRPCVHRPILSRPAFPTLVCTLYTVHTTHNFFVQGRDQRVYLRTPPFNGRRWLAIAMRYAHSCSCSTFAGPARAHHRAEHSSTPRPGGLRPPGPGCRAVLCVQSRGRLAAGGRWPGWSVDVSHRGSAAEGPGSGRGGGGRRRGRRRAVAQQEQRAAQARPCWRGGRNGRDDDQPKSNLLYFPKKKPGPGPWPGPGLWRPLCLCRLCPCPTWGWG